MITMMNDFVIAYAIQLIYDEKKKKVDSMQNLCNYVIIHSRYCLA